MVLVVLVLISWIFRMLLLFIIRWLWIGILIDVFWFVVLFNVVVLGRLNVLSGIIELIFWLGIILLLMLIDFDNIRLVMVNVIGLVIIVIFNVVRVLLMKVFRLVVVLVDRVKFLCDVVDQVRGIVKGVVVVGIFLIVWIFEDFSLFVVV